MRGSLNSEVVLPGGLLGIQPGQRGMDYGVHKTGALLIVHTYLCFKIAFHPAFQYSLRGARTQLCSPCYDTCCVRHGGRERHRR